MARLEASGMRNCGIISLSCLTKKYPSTNEFESVPLFSNNVVHKPFQPYGCTKDMPLDELMEEFETSSSKYKIIQCALSESQRFANDGKLHKRLKKYGFRVIRKFRNSSGSTGYLYLKIPEYAKMKLEKGDR